MIKILPDKNGKLTQWDKDRRVIIVGLDDLDGVKVHFSSPNDSKNAYVVEPTVTDDIVTADIPDALLTIAGTIHVYICPETYTRSATVLNVFPREKPDDYVYGGGGAPQVQADWNQNDDTAVDHIKNRPGGYTKTVPGFDITWDGVIGDKTAVDAGNPKFVKVSDLTPTVDELIGATVTTVWDGETNADVISEERVVAEDDVIVAAGDAVVIAPIDGASFNGFVFPKAGVYFVSTGDADYVSGLSKPDTVETVKIPKKFLDLSREAVLINPVEYPTDDTLDPTAPVILWFTDDAIADDEALTTKLNLGANGYAYIASSRHEAVLYDGDWYPTNQVLEVYNGRRAVLLAITGNRYRNISYTRSSLISIKRGTPVCATARDFTDVVSATGDATFPYPITGVVSRATERNGFGAQRLLVRALAPYEKVELNMVSTNVSGSAVFNDISPLTDSDVHTVVNLGAAQMPADSLNEHCLGVAKVNYYNGYDYVRKFYVSAIDTDANTVTGYFITGCAGTTNQDVFSNITLRSVVSGSTKKFKITVDDSGTLAATEVTE